MHSKGGSRSAPITTIHNYILGSNDIYVKWKKSPPPQKKSRDVIGNETNENSPCNFLTKLIPNLLPIKMFEISFDDALRFEHTYTSGCAISLLPSLS